MQPEDDDHYGGTRRNQRPRNNFSVSKPETGWPGAGVPVPGHPEGSKIREIITRLFLRRFTALEPMLRIRGRPPR